VLADRLLDILLCDRIWREQRCDTPAVGEGSNLYGDELVKVGGRGYAMDFKRHDVRPLTIPEL
jgi:hypothetical protein